MSDEEMTADELAESASNEDLAHANADEKIRERLRLQNEVEAFLASGGQIRHIPANVRADPPKKPESNYGGQPI